jgi:hypothetical protein
MNERYKELAEQAGWDNHHSKFDTRIKKFAELIVNDCIQELKISRKCDPYTGDVYNYSEYNKCIDEQINILKERFGVEE